MSEIDTLKAERCHLLQRIWSTNRNTLSPDSEEAQRAAQEEERLWERYGEINVRLDQLRESERLWEADREGRYTKRRLRSAQADS